MKQFTSVLSTDQLIQLGRELLAGDSLRHFNSLARSHELYYSDPNHNQGGTPHWNRQAMIEYIASCHGGTAPDDIVRNRDAQVAATAQKSKSVQSNGAVAVRIIDLSKQGQPQAQAPNTLVAVGCAGCGIRLSVTIAELEQYREAYCPKCLGKANSDWQAAQKAILDFIAAVPSFYPHEANVRLLGDECERRKITRPTLDHLIEIYAEVRSQMPFKRLTEAEGIAMTSQQWDELIKRDPGAGGLNLAAAKEGQTRGEQVTHSSNNAKFNQFQPTGTRGF